MYGAVMLFRLLFSTGLAAVAGVAGAAIVAADPEPAPTPTIPDVNTYVPVNPADYAANDGRWFAFAGPPGVICTIDNLSGEYGCSGPLPGAPEGVAPFLVGSCGGSRGCSASLPGAPAGVNLVSGGPTGVPTFSTTAEPSVYAAAAGAVKALPPNTRISFGQVSCGVDADGAVACVNSLEQVGFVVGPTTSYVGVTGPL